MKSGYKDAQTTIRASSEILDAMRSEAKSLNMSLSDFIIKLYQDRNKTNDLESRVSHLERLLLNKDAA